MRSAFLMLLVALSAIGAFSEEKTRTPENCEAVANGQPGVVAPKVTADPDPYYPHDALDVSRGTVVLELVVGANGKPCGVTVVRSTDKRFEPPALEAIRSWRWKPAKKDGKPVAVRVSVQMNFRKQ